MRNRKCIELKSIALYMASFCIPCIILIAAMYLLKTTPFGNDTLLFLDSGTQYINYMGYLKSIFAGENDIFYTFSKNLGGDVISLASYYLLSPFNLLFAFSSVEKLPSFYTMVMVLKISLCGLSYYHSSSRIWEHKVSNLIFSTSYALMAYNMIYVWNIMWLDGVMILPILGLGLYKIWKGEGKYGTYIFAIAYALCTNFYIGYMICIASVMLCLACMFVNDRPLKERGCVFGKYIMASCIGGLTVAFVWLPAFLSLRSGRATFHGGFFTITPQFDLLEFSSKFVAGASNWQELIAGMPHVFSGTPILVLTLVFFASRNVPIKKRIAALVTMLVFLTSFYIKALDIVWHGFSPNRCFNFRYSFIFSYVLITVAHWMLSNWNLANRKMLPLAALLLAGLQAVVILKQYDVALIGVCVSAGVLLAASGCLWAGKLPKIVTSLLLVVLTIFEMGINCWQSWDRMLQEAKRLNYSEYYNFVQQTKPAVEYVKALDSGFYRMEKTFNKDSNDPMLLSYNGLSHFSSAEKTFVMEFMQKMGYKNYWGFWAYYNTGSTAEADALLGVKYILSQEDLSESKQFEQIDVVNDIGIYENRNALSIAFLADPEIRNVSMGNPDYFALHNEMWSGILGEDTQLLTEETAYTVTINNLKETILENGSRLYEKIDTALPASICYEIAVSQEMPLYYYFTAAIDEQKVNVFVNGEDDGAYFDAYRWDMSNAGTYPESQRVTIELVCNEDQMILNQGYFYYEDLNALKKAAAAVQGNPVQLEKHSSSHFSGRFETEKEQVLVFTVPFEEGWQVTLNGEQVKPEKVLDTFLSVSVPEGTHEFEIRYIPQGTYAGCGLSVLSAVLALLWYQGRRRKDN